MRFRTITSAALLATLLSSSPVLAGPIFLTGHDPDFHGQKLFGDDGENLLRAGLDFATAGSYSTSGDKFLWVESDIAVPGGHLRGKDALTGTLGLVEGIHFEAATASDLGSINFSDFSAIGVASSFGGTLTRAELDGLIARKTDIANFINGGGGLFASSECYPCGADLLAGLTAPDLFGYLPIDVTSIGADAPFTVTPYGISQFGLTDADVDDPTHNSFGLTGGLNVVDFDQSGNATTLAGNVLVDDGGFTPVPAPGTLGLIALGLLGLRTVTRRRR